MKIKYSFVMVGYNQSPGHGRRKAIIFKNEYTVSTHPETTTHTFKFPFISSHGNPS